MHILIIDDEVDFADTLKSALRSANHVVDSTYTARDGLFYASTYNYDLIILDLILPDMNGIELCKKLRRSKIESLILMLTGKDKVSDRVLGLDAGADDYLVKPFSFAELKARIRALCRRKGSDLLFSNQLKVDDLTLDTASQEVTFQGEIVQLRRKEYLILAFLMRNVGKVVSRERILENAWEADIESVPNIVNVHIKHLRCKLDKRFNTQIIKTVHGSGYKIDKRSNS
ncbi:MAG: response regulator transcription factor [Candidatus Woesebacteria bacterium]|jgi:DNA-binding response OmpR family regulator